MKIVRWIGPALAGLAMVGCGSSPVAEVESPANPAAPAVAIENREQATTPTEDRDSFQPATPVVNAPAANLPVAPDSAPDVVVKEFLNALKSGDDGVTAGLLTETARVETAKHNLAVQPPGTPTAQYQVTAAEIDQQDPTFAQVACLWTETDDQGGKRTDEVIWVLKKETQGWRVCGMATHIPTRQEPILFNFEDPVEMMKVSDQVAQELEKLSQTPPTESSVPAALEAKGNASGNSLRK